MSTMCVRRAMAFSIVLAIVAANLVPALALGHSHRKPPVNPNAATVIPAQCTGGPGFGTSSLINGNVVVNVDSLPGNAGFVVETLSSFSLPRPQKLPFPGTNTNITFHTSVTTGKPSDFKQLSASVSYTDFDFKAFKSILPDANGNFSIDITDPDGDGTKPIFFIAEFDATGPITVTCSQFRENASISGASIVGGTPLPIGAVTSTTDFGQCVGIP